MDLEQRVAALETALGTVEGVLGMESGLRASQDHDLADLAAGQRMRVPSRRR